MRYAVEVYWSVQENGKRVRVHREPVDMDILSPQMYELVNDVEAGSKQEAIAITLLAGINSYRASR